MDDFSRKPRLGMLADPFWHEVPVHGVRVLFYGVLFLALTLIYLFVYIRVYAWLYSAYMYMYMYRS